MNIILTGGGTAGHVSPALAVAEEILRSTPSSRILFIGRDGGEENEAVRKAGIELRTLRIRGLKRQLGKDSIKSIYYALRAQREAKKIIREFSPDVILGTGGYVSWPVIRAGASLKIPTAIHESNSVPGLTTKLLSRTVNILLLNHSMTKDYLGKKVHTCTVGNPIFGQFCH